MHQKAADAEPSERGHVDSEFPEITDRLIRPEDEVHPVERSGVLDPEPCASPVLLVADVQAAGILQDAARGRIIPWAAESRRPSQWRSKFHSSPLDAEESQRADGDYCLWHHESAHESGMRTLPEREASNAHFSHKVASICPARLCRPVLLLNSPSTTDMSVSLRPTTVRS